MTDTQLTTDFKKEFIDFLKQGLGSCDSFIMNVEKCETFNDLRKMLRSNSDTVVLHLGYDCDVDDLEDENERLGRKVENLEIEISKLEDKIIPSDSIWDEEKLQSFIDYRDKYTPWEFEALLKNGKL